MTTRCNLDVNEIKVLCGIHQENGLFLCQCYEERRSEGEELEGHMGAMHIWRISYGGLWTFFTKFHNDSREEDHIL